jgi:hypothetical protein
VEIVKVINIYVFIRAPRGKFCSRENVRRSREKDVTDACKSLFDRTLILHPSFFFPLPHRSVTPPPLLLLRNSTASARTVLSERNDLGNRWNLDLSIATYLALSSTFSSSNAIYSRCKRATCNSNNNKRSRIIEVNIFSFNTQIRLCVY